MPPKLEKRPSLARTKMLIRKRQNAAARERRTLPSPLETALRIIDGETTDTDPKTLESLAYRFFLKSVEKMLRSITKDEPLPESLKRIFEMIRRMDLNAADYGKIGAHLLDRAQEKFKAAKKQKRRK